MKNERAIRARAARQMRLLAKTCEAFSVKAELEPVFTTCLEELEAAGNLASEATDAIITMLATLQRNSR